MILIVDDKKENLFALKTLLELHRYVVETASSGEEALRKILRADFSVIILDVQMPDMDGFELAETLGGYSRSRDIPILFLSAVNVDKKFITKGYASGGVDYITKPFDPDVLLLKVKTFKRLREQTREVEQMRDALKQANLTLEDKVRERTRELEQLNRELAMSNADLQQYASLASHDLQEPLRKIITFSRLLEDRCGNLVPEEHGYLKKIIASSERMRNLINDLLDYSRLSFTPQFAPCNLNEVLNNTLADLEVAIAEKKAVVETMPLPVIEAMPGQMQQVFQNLISNALKFSKPGQPPVIKISSERVSAAEVQAPLQDNGDFVRITVQDNGIGFNEMFLNKIFTIFQRLHTKEQYEGTGIGLAIVKKIVEKHHGAISAASREGEGATFTLVFPLRQQAILSPTKTFSNTHD